MLQSCGETKTTIILYKSSSNYVEWISNEATIVLDAYNISNTDSISLALADGIILTGGEDINLLCMAIRLIWKYVKPLIIEEILLKKIDGLCFEKQNSSNRGLPRHANVKCCHWRGSLYGDIPSQLGTEVIHRDQGEVMRGNFN